MTVPEVCSGMCRYKHIFGKERTGFHAVRLFDIAVLDVLGTVAIAYGIARIGKFSVWVTMLVLFAVAILAHRLFCVRTTVDRFLFGSENPI